MTPTSATQRSIEPESEAPAPTDAATDTRRFTIGLVLDVARVIEAHGYAAFEGRDLVELRQHLLHLLHAPGSSCTGGSSR